MVRLSQAARRAARLRGVPVIGASSQTDPARSAPCRVRDGLGRNRPHKRKAVVFGLPDLVFIGVIVEDFLQPEGDAVRWAPHRIRCRPGAAYKNSASAIGEKMFSSRSANAVPHGGGRKSCRRHRMPRRARASTPAARPPLDRSNAAICGPPRGIIKVFVVAALAAAGVHNMVVGQRGAKRGQRLHKRRIVPCRQERAAGADHGFAVAGVGGVLFCIGSK